ncbi:protein white-like isoform X1 [Montipora capricornis]|uniref:protein white-like isoform X1 n=2 Tax=Montipora capricornis TaxID=246305 RepID=UPI0035F1D7EB
MKGEAHSRSSLLPSKANPRRLGYSTFGPGASANNGQPFGDECETPQNSNVTDIKDSRDSVSISWQNINVFVRTAGPSFFKRMCFQTEEDNTPKKKQVLFNVSGKVKAGSLLAVMGASGAGKSTLMNVLAHRNISHMEVSGTVEVNDCPIGREINAVSAYVQQEDLFIGSLTVREHLTFQAFLRMDKHVPDQQRIARVEEVILQLGLMKCADTYIGIAGRLSGISGGEKKRLSFASEVITDPPLLFADEPTSGLDSFMAESLVAALQQLAAQGRTIICTIHQPSSEVYAMFDSILLLAEGRTAYMGATTSANQYFDSLGYPCPINFNPADHFVHTLAIIPGDEQNCQRRVQGICDEFTARQCKETEPERVQRQDSFKSDDYYLHRSPYKASYCRQFRSVFWRAWLTNNRDTAIFRIRLYQSVLLGLLSGIIYFQTKMNQGGIINLSGALYFLLTSISFNNLGAVVFTFPVELSVFLREHHNGMYRTDVYFLSKTFAEAPLFVLNPLILIAIAYWMIGLRDQFLRFLYAYGILALVSMVAVSYGYIVSTVSPTVPFASAISAPLMLPLVLIGGFYIRNNTIPAWLSWLKYVSWFHYAFEALLVNQWDGYGNITCSIKDNRTDTSCLADGNDVIEFLQLDKNHVLIDIYSLLALTVIFRCISFLFLLKKAYKKP